MLYKFLFLFAFSSFFFIACSDDSSSSPPSLDDMQAEVSSSSSSTKKTSSSSSRKQQTVYDTLMVKDSSDAPYYSEDTTAFQWDVPMSVEQSSSSIASPTSSNATVTPSSSSITAEILPPVVQGDSLIDTRDGNVYRLTMVEKVIWMAENINYETSKGSMCYGNDDCSKGSLYTFEALKEVCPNGWRLPTRAEFEEAANSAEYPWSFGGRMKNSTYAYQDDMGFYWLDTKATIQDGDTENCSSDDCAMIFVKKAPDYGNGEFLFQSDSKDKGFSVRCVKK